MRIIDVSLPLTDKLPVWPGDPRVILERVKDIADGANSNVSLLQMRVHSGTHVDAPVHFFPGEKGIEGLVLHELIGPCFVSEIPSEANVVTRKILEGLQIPSGVRRLLIKTKNSYLWTGDETEFSPEFVGLSEDGAEWMVEREIKVVGIDYLSIAPYKQSRPTHEVLLGAEVIVIEGLDLHAVTAGYYSLICLPIKLVGSDGAPARVVLIDEV
jgi:arylformamidase